MVEGLALLFLFVLFILTLDFFRIKELQQKELINSFHLTQFWPKCHFRHCFPGRICRIWVYCVDGNQFRHLQTLKLRPDSAQLQLQYVSVNESGDEWWVTEAVSELCVSTADFWANYFWSLLFQISWQILSCTFMMLENLNRKSVYAMIETGSYISHNAAQ